MSRPATTITLKWLRLDKVDKPKTQPWRNDRLRLLSNKISSVRMLLRYRHRHRHRHRHTRRHSNSKLMLKHAHRSISIKDNRLLRCKLGTRIKYIRDRSAVA